MLENITVGILVLIILAAGIWSWWFTNHDDTTDIPVKKEGSDE